MNFPEIEAFNLEGRKFTLPQDLDGTLNVVIMPFLREQQEIVDQWVAFLKNLVQKVPDIEFYEVPTLQARDKYFQLAVDEAMRAGIPDKSARERTITIYTNREEFLPKLNIKDLEIIQIFLLNKDGQILWRSDGDFTKQKGLSLENAINENL
jgi:hypothetical protein